MQFDQLRQEILDQLSQVIMTLAEKIPQDEIDKILVLEKPQDPEHGDFAFPAFRLSKLLRKSPPQIAAEIKDAVSQNKELEKLLNIKTLGPYLNFQVKEEVLTSTLLSQMITSGDALGEKITATKPKIVLEFSSPNVAKAFNIYHLRGTMIGNCLYRIFKARGYDPVSINHLGDWGTQFGTITLAFQKWGNDAELQKRGIEYLVELYIRINKDIKENSDAEAGKQLLDQARANFAKLEAGDATLRGLWQKFVDLSLKEFQHTYKRLNVEFDHYWGESFYTDKIAKVEKLLEDRNLLKESDGADIVDLTDHGMPPCLVRKADGSTLYATRDLAAALYRQERFQFDKMVYIVGGEQKLHFAQLFKVLELAGCEWAQKCTHVGFGLYRFGNADGSFEKMSTRRGTFVTMESVLDEAVSQVETIMSAKTDLQMSPEERKETAEIIGVGAIIFNDLCTDRVQDINFDLVRVLDFDGETGPYIQYAHTRCLGIVRNAPAELLSGIDTSKLLDLTVKQEGFAKLAECAKKHLKEKEEILLLRTLAQFPLILDQVIEQYKPNHLTNYLIDITKAFNVFYRAQRVLVDDQDLARARLGLLLATQRTLLKGLTLLGMRVPARM